MGFWMFTTSSMSGVRWWQGWVINCAIYGQSSWKDLFIVIWTHLLGYWACSVCSYANPFERNNHSTKLRCSQTHANHHVFSNTHQPTSNSTFNNYSTWTIQTHQTNMSTWNNITSQTQVNFTTPTIYKNTSNSKKQLYIAPTLNITHHQVLQTSSE